MTAIDMSQFIAAKSDQLNSDDLMGGPRTVTITGVKANPDSAEQPVSISYQGDDGKPFKPCKTMRRVMVAVWGPDASKYVGRSMTLYRDAKVAFGGMQVGGIRISHMSHMDGEMTVSAMVTRGKKAPIKIFPLVTQPQVDKAAQWVDGFLAKLAQTDAADVRALVESNQKVLDKLKAERPQLYQGVEFALSEREPFEEGRATSDMGDPFSGSGDEQEERITDDLLARHAGS